jgi:hypothetical protein
MTSPPFLGGGELAESRPARRVLGRTGGTREAEMGKQKPQCRGAGGHRRAQGPATEARGRHPQAERPLRGPDVPEARDREVEPPQPRAGRDRGGHHGAPSPLRPASSRSLTTARGMGASALARDALRAARRGRPRRARRAPAHDGPPSEHAWALALKELSRARLGRRRSAASFARSGARRLRSSVAKQWRSPKRAPSIRGASGKLTDPLRAGRQSAKPPTAKSRPAGGLRPRQP